MDQTWPQISGPTWTSQQSGPYKVALIKQVACNRTQLSQFDKWVPSLNGGNNASLSLEFKTNHPDGLLLYTDDGGYTDFVEIKVRIGTILSDNMNCTVGFCQLFSEIDTGVPALLPCDLLPRQ